MVLMDLSPISETLAKTVNPANCYGCEVRMAKQLGADFVLVGIVQKVSNLILSMNLVMRAVETGKVVRARVVDIRSKHGPVLDPWHELHPQNRLLQGMNTTCC